MSDDLDDFDDFLLSMRDDGEFSEVIEEGDAYHSTFESMDTIIDLSKSAFADFKTWYRLPSLSGVSDPWLKSSYPEEVHAIRSMVGDDEVCTTNSLIYAVMCIIIGPIISRIIISWEDVQFNKNLFNYAEGWVFLPPSRDSDFDSVNRYNKGNGVPFVLDSVKFKDLSCVRKQSAMESDLPSKFKNLAERAAWTHPRWPTWNSHQWSLILGIEIFDFMRSNMFPYLFEYEGGCGGAPPWNNVFTAAAAIHRYRNGRAKRGIIGVMSDAGKLQRGEIRPEEAYFTKGLNLALSGDKRWEVIRSKLERDKHDALQSGMEYIPKVSEDAETTIPEELSQLGATIDPSDALTGVAVSFLREKGYILTEMDLVMKVESEKRLRAVWGILPMREIEDQIKLRKSQYRDAYLETISELSKTNLLDGVRFAKSAIEDPFDPQSQGIMISYYKVRVEQALRLNSFMYNDRIRVFKFEDVEAYFNRGVKGIKDRFSQSVGSYYRPEHRKSIQNPRDAEVFDEVEKWLSQNKSLDWLLSQPLPPGIGPDDSRIVRDLNVAMDVEVKSHEGFVILIVTGDKRLVQNAQRILSHNFPQARFRVCGMRVPDFLTWCLVRPRPWRTGIDGPPPPPWLRGRIFNPIEGMKVDVHGPLLRALKQEAVHLWSSRSPKLIIEYDFPNINRGLARFRLNPQGFIEELSGGYLTSEYLATDRSFSVRPIEELLDLSEFARYKRRSYYPSRMVGDRPLQLYSAVSYAMPSG